MRYFQDTFLHAPNEPKIFCKGKKKKRKNTIFCVGYVKIQLFHVGKHASLRLRTQVFVARIATGGWDLDC